MTHSPNMFGISNGGQSIYSLGGTNPHFYPLGDSSGSAGTTTEADTQVVARGTVTWSLLGVQVRTNSTTLGFFSRIDSGGGAADGNQAVSGVTTTGHKQDATHSDALIASYKYSAKCTHTASNSATLGAWEFKFNASSGNAGSLVFSSASDAYSLIQSNTYFIPIIGGSRNDTPNTTETNLANTKLRTAGTLSNMAIYANNTGTASGTLHSRKSTTDQNQSVSLVASTSGIFTDATNTDTVAAGDIWKSRLVMNAGGTSRTAAWVSFWFVGSGTSTNFDFGSSWDAVASSVSTGARNYLPVFGKVSETTTLLDVQITVPFNFTASNLRCTVQTNSATNSPALQAWINGAGGSQSVSLTNGTTGDFEDVTHTDAPTSGQTLAFSHDQPNSSTWMIAECMMTGNTGTPEHRPRRILLSTGNR